MIKKSEKAINFGAAFLVAVAVICIAVTVTVLARPLYYFDIEHLNIAQNSGYSAEACKLNYDVLIDYNLLGGEDELILPTLTMSEQGRIHFEEVKDIFVTMQIISLVGIAALVAVVIWFVWHTKKFREFACGDTTVNTATKSRCSGRCIEEKHILWMKYTGYVCRAVAVIVCLTMLIDWQWAFTMMHNIFFDNDYWLFNPYTDPVIRILPDEFFFHCGILIILLVIIQVVGLRIAYNRLSRLYTKDSF